MLMLIERLIDADARQPPPYADAATRPLLSIICRLVVQ